MLAAARWVLAERGYVGMSVEQVVDRSGVSRTTFYELYADKRGCLLAAHGQSLDRLMADIVAACAREQGWAERTAAAVRSAVGFAVRAPEEARILLLDGVGGEPTLVERVLGANALFAELLRAGRALDPGAPRPELLEQALVGGVATAIGNPLATGQPERLAPLEQGLVEFVLTPYVGMATARRIATVGPG